MRKLFSVLTDSFVIWSRNFTLIYVFLLILLLLSVIIPQSELPAMEMRWFLLFGVILLLFGAVMGGWYNMVALACERFLASPKEQTLRQSSPLDAFTLFKAFLPGISRFFIPVTGGFLIQFLMAGVLALPVLPYLDKQAPLMEKLAKLGLDDRLRLIESMTQAQREGVVAMLMLMLAGMLVYMLFSLLTMLWPAFVVYYKENPFKACFRSIAQLFKDPLTMIALCLLVICIKVPLSLLASRALATDNFIFTAGILLGNLLAEIFIAVMIFVYVYKSVGPPVQEPEAPDEPTPDVEEDED